MTGFFFESELSQEFSPYKVLEGVKYCFSVSIVCVSEVQRNSSLLFNMLVLLSNSVSYVYILFMFCYGCEGHFPSYKLPLVQCIVTASDWWYP